MNAKVATMHLKTHPLQIMCRSRHHLQMKLLSRTNMLSLDCAPKEKYSLDCIPVENNKMSLDHIPAETPPDFIPAIATTIAMPSISSKGHE